MVVLDAGCYYRDSVIKDADLVTEGVSHHPVALHTADGMFGHDPKR